MVKIVRYSTGIVFFDQMSTEPRDHSLYFALIEHIVEEIPYYPAVSMVVRYSLDSRVPVIGSPLKTKVDWVDLHPGYRLVGFYRGLKEILKREGFMDVPSRGDSRDYWVSLQDIYLQYSHYAGKELGKLTMWDDNDVKKYNIDTDILLNALTEKGKIFASNRLDRWKPVMDHAYSSFNLYKQSRVNNPLQFYTSVMVGITDDDIEKYKWEAAPHSYALFSVFNGNIESYHTNTNKNYIYAVFLFIENKTVEFKLKGLTKDATKKILFKNYKFMAGDPEMFEAFSTYVNYTIDDVFDCKTKISRRR